MRATAALGVALGGALLGTALAGRTALVTLVLAVCVLLLLDVQGVLLRAQAPAILPAAAVVGLGAPIAAARGAGAATFAALVVVGLLIAIVATLAAGRRRAAVSLGTTILAGVVPGLGGSAVIALWDRDPLGLLVLLGIVVAGETALWGAKRWGSGSREAEAGTALVAVAAAGALAVLALPVTVAAGFGALVLLGVLGASALRSALLWPGRPLPGMLLAVTASLALAAPAALAVLGQMPPGS